jgi:hypothetical protein
MDFVSMAWNFRFHNYSVTNWARGSESVSTGKSLQTFLSSKLPASPWSKRPRNLNIHQHHCGTIISQPRVKNFCGRRGENGKCNEPECIWGAKDVNIVSVRSERYSVNQGRTEEGVEGVLHPPPPKFRSFDKAEPNSQFRGKYFRNSLIRIRVSHVCKLSRTPD